MEELKKKIELINSFVYPTLEYYEKCLTEEVKKKRAKEFIETVDEICKESNICYPLEFDNINMLKFVILHPFNDIDIEKKCLLIKDIINSTPISGPEISKPHPLSFIGSHSKPIFKKPVDKKPSLTGFYSMEYIPHSSTDIKCPRCKNVILVSEEHDIIMVSLLYNETATPPTIHLCEKCAITLNHFMSHFKDLKLFQRLQLQTSFLHNPIETPEDSMKLQTIITQILTLDEKTKLREAVSVMPAAVILGSETKKCKIEYEEISK